MLRTRVIPCLQLINDSLVKTVKFSNPSYIGDPINTVRIFNELEVDELCFLDIRAASQNREPNIKLLKQIADECFMPLSYGGGIRTFEMAKQILSIGFEKIILNTSAFTSPDLIRNISEYFGSQSLVLSMDIKKNVFGKYQLFVNDGTKRIDDDVITSAKKMERLGVGEILLTSMDRDGTWSGYDLKIIKEVSESLNIPVIANGGAGSVIHLEEAVKKSKASAVAIGSMVVYQKKGMGVLINFPDKSILNRSLA